MKPPKPSELVCGLIERILLWVNSGMHTQVNPGYPGVTEQDPSLLCEILISKESESLPELVLELRAQHRCIATARRFIKKKWTDSLEMVD